MAQRVGVQGQVKVAKKSKLLLLTRHWVRVKAVDFRFLIQ